MNKIISYKKAVEYIFSLRKPRENYTLTRNTSQSDVDGPGIHLERLRKFLDFVGNPQNDYQTIHVGGTAGKGSVTYLISKILIEHGLNVATHTSPYLISINEKFQVNLKNISNENFVKLTNWLAKNLQIWEEQTNNTLSYYEAIIAMVFKYFSLQEVDVAVVEVGMGGKLDATNVINSEIAVLTNVGLDHTEILGDTKEAILKDKVEIMKPGKTFITGVEEPELLKIVKHKAEEKQNKLFVLKKDFKTESLETKENINIFSYKSRSLNINNIHLSLEGEFQISNAALAIKAVSEYLGNKLKPSILQKALSNSKFPGRMEIYSQSPLIIFDGAHNDSKIEALVNSVNKIYGDKKVKLLISIKKGKNLENMITQLSKLNISEIVVTEFEWEYYDKLVSFEIEYLANKLHKQLKAEITSIKDPFKAFDFAASNVDENELLLVTGSLYLLGTLYQKLKS